MRNPFVSILIPYYNRPQQMKRALWLLERQTYPDYEVVIVDDGSTKSQSLEFPLRAGPGRDKIKIYYYCREPHAKARSPNKAWRKAFEYSSGDFVILSHPEIMVPLDAIDIMVMRTPEMRRGVPLQYCLDYKHQLKKVDWRTNLKNLEQLPDFMATTSPWLYFNYAAGGYRHHLSFSGADRDYWEQFGFLPNVEDPNFQSDDTWLHGKELEAGTPPLPVDLTVYHQYHERVYGDIPQYSHKIKQIRKMYEDDEAI